MAHCAGPFNVAYNVRKITETSSNTHITSRNYNAHNEPLFKMFKTLKYVRSFKIMLN